MTLACLKSLYQQTLVQKGDVILKVFLCDDASTDGTVEEVRKNFPEVAIVNGSGDLFWAKGMEVAFSEARKSTSDFYLMVNDDVVFDNSMLSSLLNAYTAANSIYSDVAVVGSIKDAITGEWSYGGKDWNKKWFKDVKKAVLPSAPYAECQLANWNCFLLPETLAEKVGNIENVYDHAMADYDYSIRILKSGGHIVTSDQYVGACSRNETKGTWQDVSIPLNQRYKLLHKKTARPVKSYIHYCKVAYDNSWFYWFILQYVWIAKTSIVYKLRGYRA